MLERSLRKIAAFVGMCILAWAILFVFPGSIGIPLTILPGLIVLPMRLNKFA